MIKSIIVDDERKHRETCRLLLETYCPSIEVIAEAQDKSTFIKVLNECKPDLVFLDINLGSSLAFDVLDDLEGCIDFRIVFVTASERYAIEGYKYNAIDYLLKPIKVENLIEVVKKVSKQQSQSISKEIRLDEIMELYEGDIFSIKIPMNKTEKKKVLKIKDILYCKRNDNHTIFKMLGGSEISISKNLSYFENKLEAHQFHRIHESCLVNINCIQEVSQDHNASVLMNNNEKLQVSKTYKNELLECLKIR